MINLLFVYRAFRLVWVRGRSDDNPHVRAVASIEILKLNYYRVPGPI